MDAMRVRLRYLVEDMDRHGNVRLYVRIPGKPKVRIRAQFGTASFMEEYRSAIDQPIPTSKHDRKAEPGSFRHLCQLYFASPQLAKLDASTRQKRRRYLEGVCLKHGNKPFALM